MREHIFSREVAPTFEIYDDWLEITSYGGLPQGLSEQEIFQGYSIPRNQELMRIYKDLNYVEQLGSGVPLILEHYGEEAFCFSRNFLRMILPSNGQTTEQVTEQVLKLLKAIKGNRSRSELQEILNLKDREYFRKDYLKPAIEAGFVGLTIPDGP